jgi:hypothetical protein
MNCLALAVSVLYLDVGYLQRPCMGWPRQARRIRFAMLQAINPPAKGRGAGTGTGSILSWRLSAF